jgi:hypothetical protein
LEPSLEGVDEVLDRLIDKDLLRSTGTDTFAFRHILIREVAYQTLTRAERGRLHAAAAEWLAGIAGEREDSLAELIAFHYREAASIATAQRPGDLQTAEVRQKAAAWLMRAGEVAAAAAATVEGSRHLRGAIEFADSSRLPDLYQRLGEIGESGDFAVPAYLTALRLCREQGRPPEQELQVMTGLLSFYTRSQGSVADRLSFEAMRNFRREAREVAARVTDERLLARYMAADAFYPFWMSGGSVPISPADLEEANTNAAKAVTVARRLNDPNLESMALDALSGNAQISGDWTTSREYARQRLTFQDRLSMVEKVDAHSMVAWGSSVLGDFDEADRVSAQGLAQIQPGQVPAWTLHLVGWRLYAMTMLGRWDEALLLGERARQLWLEARQPAAGYAIRGIVAAIDVARGRQDDRLAESYREMLDTIVRAFPDDSPFRPWADYGGPDLAPMVAVVSRMARNATGLSERGERALCRLLDAGQLPGADLMEALLAWAERGALRPLEAQAQRGLGLLRQDRDMLARSLALWEEMGAVPFAARVRCELALITGDRAELDKGLAVLERLGDRLQVTQYERRQVG